MEKRNSSEVIEPKTVVRKRVRFEVAEAGSSSAGFGVGRGFSRTTAERYRHLHNYVFEQTKPNRNASKEEAKEYRYLMQIKREVVCFSESTSGGVDVYNDLSASKWSAEQKKQLSRIIGGTEVTDPYLCNGEAHKRVTESLITESGLVQKVRLLLTEDEVESVIKQMLTGGVHGGLRQILGKLRNNYSGIDMSMVSDALDKQVKDTPKKAATLGTIPSSIPCYLPMVFFMGDVVAVGRMSTWHGKRVSHLFNVVCVTTMYAMSRPILEENSHQLACAADDIFTLVGRPIVLRLDNSKANRSKALMSVCKLHGVHVQYIQKGEKNQNAHVEKVNDTIVRLLKRVCHRAGDGHLYRWGEFHSLVMNLLNGMPRVALGCVLSAREAKDGYPQFGYGEPSSSKAAHLLGPSANRDVLWAQANHLPEPLQSSAHNLIFAEQSVKLRQGQQRDIQSLVKNPLVFDNETVDADLLARRLQNPADSLFRSSIPIQSCSCGAGNNNDIICFCCLLLDEEKTKLQMNIESELGEALSMQLNNTVGLVLDVRFCTWLCKQFGVMESKNFSVIEDAMFSRDKPFWETVVCDEEMLNFRKRICNSLDVVNANTGAQPKLGTMNLIETTFDPANVSLWKDVPFNVQLPSESVPKGKILIEIDVEPSDQAEQKALIRFIPDSVQNLLSERLLRRPALLDMIANGFGRMGVHQAISSEIAKAQEVGQVMRTSLANFRERALVNSLTVQQKRKLPHWPKGCRLKYNEGLERMEGKAGAPRKFGQDYRICVVVQSSFPIKANRFLYRVAYFDEERDILADMQFAQQVEHCLIRLVSAKYLEPSTKMLENCAKFEGCSGGSWKCINENCDQLRMRKCLNQMDWECCIRIGGCQYHSGQINESGDIIPDGPYDSQERCQEWKVATSNYRKQLSKAQGNLDDLEDGSGLHNLASHVHGWYYDETDPAMHCPSLDIVNAKLEKMELAHLQLHVDETAMIEDELDYFGAEKTSDSSVLVHTLRKKALARTKTYGSAIATTQRIRRNLNKNLAKKLTHSTKQARAKKSS